MKRAMITGITSQDGSYLAEHLLASGYSVWGFVHGERNPNVSRIQRLISDVNLVHGDLLDSASILSAIDQVQPDEVYNLAAISHVPTSWEHPELTGQVTGLGVLRILEAIREYCGNIDSQGHAVPATVRFFQASSAEIFGDAQESPQSETTPLRPRNPYGAAKAYSHFLTQHYRESYGMYAVAGILFNHESPRRSREFLSRKVSFGVASIKLGYKKKLRLGSLAPRRDWGFAGDYVRAMHLMLAQDEPEDYVIGTGITHSVEDLVDRAFQAAGLSWPDYVQVDAAFVRPPETVELRADPAKAHERLGWQPEVSFNQLVEMMVESDLRLVKETGPAEEG